MFSENGKLYIYYSTVPNDTPNVKELPPKTDRGNTLIGMQTMERRHDGKIVYSMYL